MPTTLSIEEILAGSAPPADLEEIGRSRDGDVPVTCCGVRVAPGDIVVADADGVAVVPQEKMEAIRERTRIVMEIEEEFTRRFDAGESGTELVKMMRRKWE